MALKELLTDLSSYFQNYPLQNEFNYGAGTKASFGIFDQKSLEFGKGTAFDQPKGGFSKQPYIQTLIPKGDDNFAFKPTANFGGTEVGIESGGSGVLETINSISSGLIRGGVITAGVHSVTDVLRLTQFGIDLPRGIPFISKQIGLQLSNVKMEGMANTDLKSAPFYNNNRLYNAGVNTLAQAGVNAFGIHFRRHGILPVPAKGQDDKTGYYHLVTRNNEDGNNRLKILYETFRSKKTSGDQSKQDRKELYHYIGGPKSVYGIGKTTIRSYTNTLNKPIFFKEEFEKSTPSLYKYMSLDQPTSQEQKVGGDFGPSIDKGRIKLNKLKDFRKLKANRSAFKEGGQLKSYYQKYSSDYSIKNMETRLKIGTGYDMINKKPIIRAIRKVKGSTEEGTKDLIRFFIEAVDNDNPEISDYIFFRAFIDSWGDKYKAKWKGYNFVGNPETFYNYESFDRDISLSFNIVVFSSSELKPLYQKLNALISQLMPDYKNNDTKARAPYIKLTVGDYIDRLPGFIKSLSIKPVKGATWEININDTDTIQSLPQALDISMAFQPIHNFVPRKVKKGDEDVPFITLNSRNTIEKDNLIIGGKTSAFLTDPEVTALESQIKPSDDLGDNSGQESAVQPQSQAEEEENNTEDVVAGTPNPNFSPNAEQDEFMKKWAKRMAESIGTDIDDWSFLEVNSQEEYEIQIYKEAIEFIRDGTYDDFDEWKSYNKTI